jgi:uncharacterized protein YbaR (Trm112 family)
MRIFWKSNRTRYFQKSLPHRLPASPAIKYVHYSIVHHFYRRFRSRDMVDKELLDILCCPETKQDLTLVEGSVISKINQRIKEGKLKNRAGETIKEPIDAGLLREDRKYIYAIREDIPIMLIDEAIPYDESFS